MNRGREIRNKIMLKIKKRSRTFIHTPHNPKKPIENIYIKTEVIKLDGNFFQIL